MEKLRVTIFPGRKIRMLGIALLDVFCLASSAYTSLIIRFFLETGSVPVKYLMTTNQLVVPYIVISILVYAFFHLYSSVWAYVSVKECLLVAIASFISVGCLAIVSLITDCWLPRSCYILIFFIQFLLSFALRFAYRFVRTIRHDFDKHLEKSKNLPQRIMIIGAGDAANILIREIRGSDKVANFEVICAIDDDTGKIGKKILGVPIVGDRTQIILAAEKYDIDEILFAIPSASPAVRKQYMEICSETSCTLKALPGVYQLVNNEVSVSNLKKMDITDLLGREQISLDMTTISGYLKNKTVLVTGGGGSIGSELCRQIASFEPALLIILDIYENNAFYIRNELLQKYPQLNLKVLIGSVRDEQRLDDIFRQFRPNIVYHAAAHKHVPLMEDSPNEAIKNNVLGTLNMVRTSDKYGVKRFVMISTDKAVNPTNIMGASKRICEEIVQTYNKKSKTEFVAVRFGNVLGSNGSVIPIFRKQIEEGGPITVTHPDIIRYFMTIPEAASLVLQAGAFAKGGEIFVLDMGAPVKILTLAENMIKLSGLTPYKDIDIVFTGLRPGEKLYEELLMNEEGMQSTENNLIHIGHPIDIDEDKLLVVLDELKNAIADESSDVRHLVKLLVPTFRYGASGSDSDDSDTPDTILIKNENTAVYEDKVLVSV